MIKEPYRGHFGGQGLLFYDRTKARYTLKYMIIIFVKWTKVNTGTEFIKPKPE